MSRYKLIDKTGILHKIIKKALNENREGLKDLYERNKTLIDIRIALEKYPLKNIPIIYSKVNKIQRGKLREEFKKYTLSSFMTDSFLKPFLKLRPWRK